MTTYYVDNTLGNDSNSGLDTDVAWKTIAKVNAFTFTAGDTCLFKRGETWWERAGINKSGVGTAGNRVTFGAYGSGANPIISYGYDLGTAGQWTQPNAGSYPNVWQATVGTYDIGQLVFTKGGVNTVGIRRNVGGTLDSESSGTTLYLSASSSKYLSMTADYYNGAHIYFRSGALAGQHRAITDYTVNTAPAPDDYIATVDATGTWNTSSYYMIHGYASPFLSSEGHFSHDEQNSKIYLYTANGNPGTYYDEIVACPDIVGGEINKTSTGYITVQDIDFMHCADKDAVLMLGSNTIVERCSFKWIGGGWANNFYQRDGYALAMYNVVSDVYIRNNLFYEIYDCAVTCQPGAASNIYVHHNRIWNADGALELYPGGGTYGNIYYVNNTAYGIGDGLIGSQGRIDNQSPSHHFWWHTNDTYGGTITVKNNICVMGSTDTSGRVWNYNAGDADSLAPFDSDYNCWRPDRTNLYKYNHTTFYSSLAAWQGATRSPDANSINSDPLFTDAANGDFTLADGSPCYQAGVVVSGITTETSPSMGYDEGGTVIPPTVAVRCPFRKA